MKIKGINILTIAGFDPTGGAGILADIQTFKAFNCVGMAVQTANTIQTEDEFIAVNWIDDEVIGRQLQSLLDRYSFTIVKIGLVPSLSLLNVLIDKIIAKQPNIKIVWDPVLSASAGVDFGQDLSELSVNDDAIAGAKELSNITKILLKGGHNPENLGRDILFDDEGELFFKPKPGNYSPKHGSGCVYASALAATIAKGYPQQKAILKAKRYIEYFLASSNTLIGRHKG